MFYNEYERRRHREPRIDPPLPTFPPEARDAYTPPSSTAEAILRVLSFAALGERTQEFLKVEDIQIPEVIIKKTAKGEFKVQDQPFEPSIIVCTVNLPHPLAEAVGISVKMQKVETPLWPAGKETPVKMQKLLVIDLSRAIPMVEPIKVATISPDNRSEPRTDFGNWGPVSNGNKEAVLLCTAKAGHDGIVIETKSVVLPRNWRKHLAQAARLAPVVEAQPVVEPSREDAIYILNPGEVLLVNALKTSTDVLAKIRALSSKLPFGNAGLVSGPETRFGRISLKDNYQDVRVVENEQGVEFTLFNLNADSIANFRKIAHTSQFKEQDIINALTPTSSHDRLQIEARLIPQAGLVLWARQLRWTGQTGLKRDGLGFSVSPEVYAYLITRLSPPVGIPLVFQTLAYTGDRERQGWRTRRDDF